MTVASILGQKGRKVITVEVSTLLIDVARLLSENSIGSIVVVDENERIAGIISERDIVRSLSETGPDVLNLAVSNCMTKDVITCNETETVDQIMATMTTQRFRHMPVVENGQLVGIVSIGDVVKSKIAATEMEAAAMRDYIVASG